MQNARSSRDDVQYELRYRPERNFWHAIGIMTILFMMLGLPYTVAWIAGRTILLSELYRFYEPMGWFTLFVLGGYLFLIAVGMLRILEYRPITVTNNYISSLLLGRRWRRIEWTAIACVEKAEEDEIGGENYKLIVTIVGGDKRRIPIIGTIREYDKLIALLNEYIARHSIPVFYEDNRGTTGITNLAKGRKEVGKVRIERL